MCGPSCRKNAYVTLLDGAVSPHLQGIYMMPPYDDIILSFFFFNFDLGASFLLVGSHIFSPCPFGVGINKLQAFNLRVST